MKMTTYDGNSYVLQSFGVSNVCYYNVTNIHNVTESSNCRMALVLIFRP